MKGFIGEFKKFISRGNVMDLAVGVIIGGAFQAIVSSLVNDIVMPVISLITGGLDFSAWKIMLSEGENAASINYGNFIQVIINFLIVSFCVFMLVKGINKLRRKKEEPPKKPEPPKPSNEEVLLTEIRDLLKEKK